jgi:NAD(P)-dependent dehydrogenase (short-subunit alcohol dehydrogenase family)
MSGWSTAQMPAQAGRRVIVTGANSGIGLVAARELARAGARVTLAVRSEERGRRAAAGMPGEVDVRRLDLASLDSVRAFAAAWDEPLDLLVNNAGLMAPPRATTADGFELQLGTNHLGHFALTGLLLDRLLDTADARVVTVSSNAHRTGRMRWDDLQFSRGYKPWAAYGQSKLANLLFTFELQRRAGDAGVPLRALAAHPGYTATELQKGTSSRAQELVMQVLNRVVAQPAEAGALPTLHAATADLPGATYVGPDGPGEWRGAPQVVGVSKAAADPASQRRLWEVSEELTGVSYAFAR